MNADRLLGHYEQIADAPDAVQRLRRFILDLAVRGKLVEQNPADESASALLKRIAAEKARLVKAEKIRKPKALPEMLDDELPFLLPPKWRWSQISEIGIINPRNNASEDLMASFVPMPMIAAEYGLENQYQPRPWAEIKKGYTHFAEGDVGLAKITPCFENGKSTVFRELTGGLGSGTTELHIVRPLFVNPDYIIVFLKCPHFIETGIPRMTGTAGQKRVPIEYFANSPFPLPPLAEQHRIVAKVDELMALCDRLEAARTEREATRDRLAAASLIRLNAPDPDPAIFRNHAAFALENLVPLTTRRDQIKALRQTILSLAVRGKLVEQDPNDEPAAELLRRMDVARLEMLEAGYPNPSEAQTQLKKLSTQTVPDYVENLPTGWSWATLQQCAMLVVDCKNKTAPYSPTGIRLVRTTNVKDGKLNASDQKYVNQETYEVWSARCKPETGDILITREAPMGEVCLIPPGETICLGQRIMLVRLVAGFIDRNFMLYSLRDPGLMDRVQDKPLGTTVQHLRVGGIETLLVAVPPLDEQHSIVAKVDELMVLCDRLEATLATDGECRRRLLDALLHEVLPARRSRGHLTKRKTRAPKAIQRAARG